MNFLDIHKSIEERCLFSVEQWLRSFDDASFIITDSFHGCIFSILFRKNFIAIGNVTRGIERFFSLLDLFSLRERLILSCEEYDSKKRDCKMILILIWSILSYLSIGNMLFLS